MRIHKLVIGEFIIKNGDPIETDRKTLVEFAEDQLRILADWMDGAIGDISLISMLGGHHVLPIAKSTSFERCDGSVVVTCQYGAPWNPDVYRIFVPRIIDFGGRS